MSAGSGGGGWGGGPGVDSVRDGVTDPLARSEVVGLLESMLRRLLPSTEFQGGASDSVLRRCGAPVSGQGWLMVQTVPKTVWRFLVVLQFIDKVLPYVVAQRQITMVLRQCRKLRSFRSCNSMWVRGSSWTRLSSCPLRADSVGVQTCRKLWCSAVATHHGSAAVLGQDCLHARCVQTVLGFAVLDKMDMPVVATTGAFGLKEKKTVEVAGVVDVCWRSSSTVVNVPVLMQRRCFSCCLWTSL